MAETKVIRLNSGEYAVAKLVENQDGTVTLIDALVFQVVMTDDPSKPGLAFGMAFPFAKDPSNVTLPKEVVAYSMEPNPQIEEAHHARTSKIVTPGTGLTLPKIR